MESEKKELEKNDEDGNLENETLKGKNKIEKNNILIEVEEDISLNIENKEGNEDDILIEVKNRKFDKTNLIKKIFCMMGSNLQKICIRLKIILKL